MDINYFTEFSVLADVGSFTEAAEELYLSQATLSKHIKNMEKELGELLFHRTTKKLELTEYGRLLLDDARKISALQSHYMEQLKGYQEHYPQTLRLGSINMMPHYGITNLLSGFSLEYPSIHLELINGGEAVLTEALVQGKCELAFMRSCSLDESEVLSLPLLDDYFVIVLSHAHPMASEKTLSLQQLQDEQFILFVSEHSKVTPLHTKLFQEVSFTPHIRLRLSNYVNILDLVSHNIGVTVMTWRTAHYLAGEKLAIVPLEPFSPIKLSLFSLRERPLSPVARRFMSYAGDNINSMSLIES